MRPKRTNAARLDRLGHWQLEDGPELITAAMGGSLRAREGVLMSLDMCAIGDVAGEVSHIANLVRMGQFAEARNALTELLARGAESTP